MKSWNLFFIAELENIGTESEPVEGFVLGTHEVPKSSVVIIQTVGNFSMFIYITQKASLAEEAYTLPEFRGFGYADMVWRIAKGLSNAGTLNEMEYVAGAHWFIPGEDGGWMFGNIHEWDAAGSPEPVWFGRYRDIMGVDIE